MRSAWLRGFAVIFLTMGTILFAGPAALAQLGFDAGFAADTAAKVSVSAVFSLAEGQRAGRLYITAKPEPGWHIYSITQKSGGPKATKIKLDPSDAYQVRGPFQAHPQPQRKAEKVFDGLIVESHYGQVTWVAPIEIAAGVEPAGVEIRGSIKAQPCDANTCLPPQDFAFAARLGPAPEVPLDAAGGRPAAEPPGTATVDDEPAAGTSAGSVFDPTSVAVAASELSLPRALVLGFLGGLILNLMPCVLPVIGLKLLSFMEQSGHSRGRALWLNIWYSMGLLSVFLVLATLAAFLGFGWGQLFSYQGFNITLAAIVFAMGLSFLDVWEIPIPGFAGSGRAVELTQQEGVAGAFAKGVLTTVLATPCSAPLLAPAVAWAVAQPPMVIYSVFVAVGMGMASPYLVVGAFPELIRFLPKPGAWMDTFKQVMGFVLLGTVIFLLTFIPWPYVVPTVGLLFGIWMACWWIGRTPVTADRGVKSRAWLAAAAVIGLTWLVTFGWLAGVMQVRFEEATLVAGEKTHRDENRLPWQPFTRAGFERNVAAGNTVLLDFTADWCLTCKTLEKLVLNTSKVRRLVKKNGVIPLKADWTHQPPEVTEMMELLGAKQVPMLVIFPAENPNQPTRFMGGYRVQDIVAALEKAGPSRSAPGMAQAEPAPAPGSG